MDLQKIVAFQYNSSETGTDNIDQVLFDVSQAAEKNYYVPPPNILEGVDVIVKMGREVLIVFLRAFVIPSKCRKVPSALLIIYFVSASSSRIGFSTAFGSGICNLYWMGPCSESSNTIKTLVLRCIEAVVAILIEMRKGLSPIYKSLTRARDASL